jgi:ribosomal protein L15
MNVIFIIYMIIAALFALCSLGYVAVDIVVEIRNKKEEPKPEPVIIYAPPPVVEEKAPEVIPIVEQIDAVEADELISDNLAMSTVRYESPAGHGQQAIINIGVLDKCFEVNELITLAVLKQKGLVPKNAGRLKILANGILSKPLTIKAEAYSIQAIKMIELTGGTVIILKG